GALRSVQHLDAREVEGVDRDRLEADAKRRAGANRHLIEIHPDAAAQLRAAGGHAADRDDVAGRAERVVAEPRHESRELLEAVRVDLVEEGARQRGHAARHVLDRFAPARRGADAANAGAARQAAIAAVTDASASDAGLLCMDPLRVERSWWQRGRTATGLCGRGQTVSLKYLPN